MDEYDEKLRSHLVNCVGPLKILLHPACDIESFKAILRIAS